VWKSIGAEIWVADSHVTIVRPTDALDSDWLKYWFESVEGQEFVASAKTGATKQTELSSSRLRDCLVPIPDIGEQRRIIARIKESMERIEEIESLRSSSEHEQQYLSASLIESELQGYEIGKIFSLGELVTEFRNGRSIPQDTAGCADGAIITLTAVRGISLDVGFQKPIVLPQEVAKKFSIDEGDVFVSRANTLDLVGLSAVAMESREGRLIYPDLLIKLKVDRGLIRPRYLAYALRSASARIQIKSRALGSSQTMVKISGERLREVRIPVPSLSEQDKIVYRLDVAHDLVRQLAMESRSDELLALRARILRKAFVGEL
jgi:type I restriction enzyme S subunit